LKKSVGAARDCTPSTSIQIPVDIRALANLLSVENVQKSQDEIALAKSIKISPTKDGDTVEDGSHARNFGRIAAQTLNKR